MNQYKLEQTIKAHLKQAGLSQRAAAKQLHYTPDQFNKWVKGVNRIPDVTVQQLAELLNLTDEERLQLFELAGYVALDKMSANGRESGPRAKVEMLAANHRPGNSILSGSAFFWKTAKAWNENFFRWSEASDHMRSSWAGMVIHAFGVVTARMGPGGWLKALVSLLLWIITVWLVAPILKWPLDEVAARHLACLKYGAATVLIPLLVAIVTQPDRYNKYRPHTLKAAATIRLLTFTGALVGFTTFSVIILVPAMAWYYVFSRPLPAAIGVGLTLAPLFFSYVTARRIPADRYKLFNGEVRFHQADYLFLGTFLVFGILLALFVYYFYWFLSSPVAGVVILLAGIGIAYVSQPAAD